MISSCSRWMVATMSRMSPGPGPFERGQQRTGAPELELAVPAVVRGLVVPAGLPTLGVEVGPVDVPRPGRHRRRGPSRWRRDEAPKRSSSTPTMRRPWAARWRRRTRPMGSRPVAR